MSHRFGTTMHNNVDDPARLEVYGVTRLAATSAMRIGCQAPTERWPCSYVRPYFGAAVSNHGSTSNHSNQHQRPSTSDATLCKSINGTATVTASDNNSKTLYGAPPSPIQPYSLDKPSSLPHADNWIRANAKFLRLGWTLVLAWVGR